MRATVVTWVPRVVLGCLVLAVLWLAGTGYLVQHQGTLARAHLTAARQALLHQEPAQAETLLAAAAKETRQARSWTDDLVWRGCAHLPFLGRVCAVSMGAAQSSTDNTPFPP